MIQPFVINLLTSDWDEKVEDATREELWEKVCFCQFYCQKYVCGLTESIFVRQLTCDNLILAGLG